MLQKTSTLFLVTLTVVTPLVALAQPRDICGVAAIAFNVVQIFGTVVLLVAVAMLLYSGFLFITGGGNPEAIGKARNILIFSLVGLAIALLAINAAAIVGNLVGGQFLTRCPGVIQGQ
ncbi:MAG: hypothetical protein HY473_01540 [Candidatus Sungbacteria bacterium]|uniref:TrbC/VirB2 family protein n=1 Tax=Candidatus Sungiibacteriota bacterium TaxID=2750080 RepID=A0A932YX99_9BACT|nr:hypothetical protein [Candidatus Sungbacteria bacterium]